MARIDENKEEFNRADEFDFKRDSYKLSQYSEQEEAENSYDSNEDYIEIEEDGNQQLTASNKKWFRDKNDKFIRFWEVKTEKDDQMFKTENPESSEEKEKLELFESTLFQNSSKKNKRDLRIPR